MGHSLSLQKKLVSLEHDESLLREELLALLLNAAQGGSEIFINSQFNPDRLPVARFGPASERLLAAASACVALRIELHLPIEGSVGGRFLAACEARASKAPHGLGPRRLAEELHSALTHSPGAS